MQLSLHDSFRCKTKKKSFSVILLHHQKRHFSFLMTVAVKHEKYFKEKEKAKLLRWFSVLDFKLNHHKNQRQRHIKRKIRSEDLWSCREREPPAMALGSMKLSSKKEKKNFTSVSFQQGLLIVK